MKNALSREKEHRSRVPRQVSYIDLMGAQFALITDRFDWDMLTIGKISRGHFGTYGFGCDILANAYRALKFCFEKLHIRILFAFAPRHLL